MRKASIIDRLYRVSTKLKFRLGWAIGAMLLTALPSVATPVYNPLPLILGQELKDTLSDRDIPTGQGSFARDYVIDLKAGDQVAIDLCQKPSIPWWF